MASQPWFDRLRNVDPRLPAAVVATLLLVFGVMWVVPTTPSSHTFTFETERRSMEHARLIELEKPVEGSLVDGSDTEFYRVEPIQGSFHLDVRLMNGSAEMIPGLRIFDAEGNLIQEETTAYVQRPGENIASSFLAQPAMTYYVQVFSQRNTIGPYTLTVAARQP